jgi:protein-disulfide isomerase
MKTLMLTLALSLCATAQASAADKGITKEQADQIIQKLDALTQRLDKLPTPGQRPPLGGMKAKVTFDPAYAIGAKDAPLTMVEFTDYECPFCSRWHTTTFEDIRRDYIDTGKLRFAVRDNPLPMHAKAMVSAEATRCAGAQHQFWPMGDRIMRNPDRLTLDQFMIWMGDLATDANAFRDCMSNHAYKADIEADQAEAIKLGFLGTPAFVIGKSTYDGVDGETFLGAQPYAAFEARFKNLEKEMK